MRRNSDADMAICPHLTVVYIDTEHDKVLAHPEFGPAHRVKLEATQARLAAAAGGACLSLRFSDVSPGQIERIGPAALVIGGNATDWAEYDFALLAGILAIIRTASVPILGICAGHQLIGFAHGAPWGPLGPLHAGEADPDPRFAPGQRKERGFLPIEVDPRCPLFQSLGSTAAFFQSHYWQLEDVPRGFAARARSPWSPVQAIERLDRPVFGVQFHPERYSAAQSDGATVLRTFFALARAGERLRLP